MNTVILKLQTKLGDLQEIYNIPIWSIYMIIYAPLVIIFLYSILLLSPLTRHFSEEIAQENHIIELATFVLLFWASLRSFVLSWQTKKYCEKNIVYYFYFIFSSALFVTAMEEISWGQQFFWFETFDILKVINIQEEITIHNIYGLQGNSEILRGIYGFGGLYGIYISFNKRFYKICPPIMLLLWFLLISIFAVLDFFIEFFFLEGLFYRLILDLPEVLELLIAISSVLFIWLNTRMLLITNRKAQGHVHS